MTFREAPKESVLYILAQSIAKRAAEQYPPSYLCDNFVPHEWVVQAVAEGIANSAEYHTVMVEMYNEALAAQDTTNV